MKNLYIVISLLLLFSLSISSQQMPIDFSDSNHKFLEFRGTGFSTRNDPKDSNNKVGQFYNDGSNATQGFYMDLTRSIDLDTQKEITLSFYSFDPNSHNITLKLENGINPDVYVNQAFSVPSPSDWKTINFDFENAKYSSNGSSVNASGTYNRLTIFIDDGQTIAGTYLIDNISDGSTPTDPNALDVIYNDLVWFDEFNGEDLNTNKWYHQTYGPNGGLWFNGELQHYTDSNTNSFVSGGNLHIVAKKEQVNLNGVTLGYSSARLNSKYAFTYGRVDVRAKLPEGNGTWPAIWTLGKNISETGAYWQTQGFGNTGWPACGEIDIMEHGLHATNSVSSALHTPSSSGNTINTATKDLDNVADNFHVYSMNWSPDQITFMIDGVGYYTYKPSSKNSATWPFDIDQFLLLNVAIGGYSGTPDTNFTESSMVIDYVRVYQNNTASIDDVFSSKFTIYPNPSSGIINIKTDQKINKIEIYSTLGKRVFVKNNSNSSVNLENLKAGIYFLKIFSEMKIATKKIIIKK
ncbi:MAG: family 16 glycosylhydrolase [Polaribacter sp.]|nr:family 16 glycosylhydrolase [Polaribacter sp.]